MCRSGSESRTRKLSTQGKRSKNLSDIARTDSSTAEWRLDALLQLRSTIAGVTLDDLYESSACLDDNSFRQKF